VLRDQRPAVLDVDLAGVMLLDCAGIGALVGVRNAAVHAGCQMWVSNPQPIVRRVLAVTGLLDVFTTPTAGQNPLPTGLEPPPMPGPLPAAVTAPRGLAVAA
jgi:anti-anti-sigma regulatory factor